LKFSKEESPLIKKEIASVLKEFVLFLEKEIFCSIFITFLKDTNDTIKIHLIDVIISLRYHKQFDSFQEFIADSILSLSIDESWRVRFTIADKINEVLAIPNISQKLKVTLVEIYAKMFEDGEAEIRNTCCLRLEKIADKIGKEDLIDKILVQFKKVEKDSVTYVRGSIANSILKVCPYIGKSKTNDFIFPVFLNLIKDENHDIRMALISNLEKLNEVINIEIFVQSVIPSLLEISSNKSWRIRNQVIEIIPTIAKILVSIFDNSLF
jgi:serine/threonine-protein phosphatase 2A regulatory subunit A